MKIKSLELETVCGITSTIPMNEKIEFAFVGRSNVGKSSLINGLMNRKSFARISQNPGKTQTINFYNINELLYFVDLPGYGFAKVSREMQGKWKKMIANYLLTSEKLRVIFQLIDIRHEPTKNDIEMYIWLREYGFNPIIIATKSDKISKGQWLKHINAIKNGLMTMEGTPVIPFSAVTKDGRDEIWEYVEEFLTDFEEDFEEELEEEDELEQEDEAEFSGDTDTETTR